MKNKEMRQHASKRQAKVYLMASLLVATVVILCCSVFADSMLSLIGVGGYSFASMAIIGNIDGTSDRYTSGNQMSAKVWLIHVDSQLDDGVPFPTPNANREMGTLPLKPGEVMHYFWAIDNTLSDTSTGEKGDITTTVTNTFSFTMGGNRDQLLNFIEEFAGGRFIIIYQICSEKEYYILGTPCKPMVLGNFERNNTAESRSVNFTFTSSGFSQPYKYKGDIVQGSPITLAADATNLPIQASKSIYLTPANNAATTALATVSGLAAADRGRVIDIVGQGGEFPTKVASSTTFILIDDVEWVGNSGSRISFKVLDAATLVEVEGSRIQTA